MSTISINISKLNKLKILILCFLFLFSQLNLLSNNLQKNDTTKNTSQNFDSKLLFHLMVSTNTSYLIFDKMENDLIYYNGIHPSIKILFNHDNHLGIGLEYSPFMVKKSSIKSNDNPSESLIGEYFAKPITLTFNYPFQDIYFNFGFGVSYINSTLISNNNLISQTNKIVAVYTYGIDYSYSLCDDKKNGVVAKGLYHSDIEKFNLQLGILFKYIIKI